VITLARRLVVAAFFFEAGLVLLILPWSAFWDRNLLFEWSHTLFELTRSAYLRGAISGLGFLNLWIGIVEVIEAWQPAPETQPSGVLSSWDEARRGRA
jgi:hypothetical protein